MSFLIIEIALLYVLKKGGSLGDLGQRGGNLWDIIYKELNRGKYVDDDTMYEIYDDCVEKTEKLSTQKLKRLYLYVLGFEHILSSKEKANLKVFNDVKVREEAINIVSDKLTTEIIREVANEFEIWL